MSFEDIKKLDDTYVMHTYGRYNVAIDHGKGAICYDPAGKSYIDFTSGIGVNSLGFADEGWVAAVTAQLNKLSPTCIIQSPAFWQQSYSAKKAA